MWAKTLLLAGFLALASAATPGVRTSSEAQTMQPGWMVPTQGQRQQNILPLRDIVDMMRGRFGGDLISARLEQGAQPFYVLRWRMDNGDTRDFRVDAASGQIR
jgi:uncharacterized membrane protein YkoI